MNTSALPIQQIVDKDLQFMPLNQVSLGTHVGYKTYRRQTAQQDGSASANLDQRSFSIVPSLGAISSKPYIYYEIPVTFTGSVANPLTGADDDERVTKLKNKAGLKPLGGNRMHQSVELSVNKKPFNTSYVSKICDLLSVSESRAVLSEISPAFKADNCAQFAGLLESTRNVLHWGSEVPPGDEFTSRGFGNNYQAVVTGSSNAGNGSVNVTFKIKEALIADPAQYRELQPNPWLDVDTLDVKIIYNQSPLRWLLNMTNSDWTVASNGVVNVNILVDEYQMSDLIPKPMGPLVYNAPKIEYEEKDVSPAIANGATGTYQSDSYRKMGVPSLIAVCLVDRRYDDSSADYYEVPHRTLEITSLNVRINNEDPKLTDLTQAERRYEVSRDNGYNGSLLNFTNGRYNSGDSTTNASNGWFLFKMSDFGVSNQYMQSNVYAQFNSRWISDTPTQPVLISTTVTSSRCTLCTTTSL